MKQEKYERIYGKASRLIEENPERKDDSKWIFDMICNDEPKLWIDSAVLKGIADAIDNALL